MKVSELIAALQTMSPNSLVEVERCDCTGYAWYLIERIENNYNEPTVLIGRISPVPYAGKRTKQLVTFPIEPEQVEDTEFANAHMNMWS
jgi:hypothetical protein